MDELLFNSSSLRPIEELDKECSEIWKDWIPSSNIEIPKDKNISILHTFEEIKKSPVQMGTTTINEELEKFEQSIAKKANPNKVQEQQKLTKEKIKQMENKANQDIEEMIKKDV